MSRPLFLVTNDDGIQSVGISTLVEHLSRVGETIVAAPDQEQSAVGHGISLHRPLRVRSIDTGSHAVSGTPADSVLLALFHLCPRRPDLVVSGINLGVNLGTDVFYSGTLAGALEGLIHGVPSIAVSQDLPAASKGNGASTLTELLDRTARFTASLASRMVQSPSVPPVTFNVNAPATTSDTFCWTRLGKRAYRETVEERLDLRGIPYYWIGGPPLLGQNAPDTDAYAIESGLISITPLSLDLTARGDRSSEEEWELQGFHLASGANSQT
jgi:5'-nucleotidase